MISTVRCDSSSNVNKKWKFRIFISSIVILGTALITSERSNLNLFSFLVKTVELGDEFCLDSLRIDKEDWADLILRDECTNKKKHLIFPSAGNVTQFVGIGCENDRENSLCMFPWLYPEGD